LIANTNFDERPPFRTLRKYEEERFEPADGELTGATAMTQQVLDWLQTEIGA